MIIGDDWRFAKYGKGGRQFVLHRWRPWELGRPVDDTNDTGDGGGGAAPSVVGGKISMTSSFSSTTVSSTSSSSEIIIGEDGLFAMYGEDGREFVLRRWRPRDLAEVRLERGCRLGLTVDDAIATGGGDGASQSVFDGKISTMSSTSSSTSASSSSTTSRSSSIMTKLEGGGPNSIIHLDVDGGSGISILMLTRRELFLPK